MINIALRKSKERASYMAERRSYHKRGCLSRKYIMSLKERIRKINFNRTNKYNKNGRY